MGWYIGEYELARIFFTRKIAIDIVVVAVYVTLAVISLLLFLALPSYRANGWLALLAAVHAIRSGLKSTKILLTLLPYFDWPFVYITEKLTDPFTVILLTLILHSAFPGALPKWLRYTTIGCGGVSALLFVLLPWQTFLGSSGVTNQIVFAILGVLFAFILFSLRRARPTFPQVITLAGIGLALYAFLWDADYFAHWQLTIFDWPFSLTQPMFIVFTMFMLVAALLTTIEKTAEREVALTQTVERQKSELTNAHITTMLSQIQPHFLYNILASINNLCQGNPAAREAILTFSDYLRGNMDSLNDNKLIPFEKELEHTRQYLWLEELRFEKRLRVVYEIEAADFLLPALTLQPLVENAVRHGVTKKEGGGTIALRTEQSPHHIRITIRDDGVGFDPGTPPPADGRSHIGIGSVRSRLASMCGGTLTVESTPGEGTTACIQLPKERVKP